MGLEAGRVTISNTLKNIADNPNLVNNIVYGVVYDVITKEDDDLAISKSIGSSGIGAIQFRALDNKNTTTNEDLPIAFPLNKDLTTLPIRNEIVIIHNFSGNWHYTRLGGDVTPNNNTLPDLISQLFNPQPTENTNSKNYQNVSQTGITQTANTGNNNKTDGFGDYFESESNILKLRLYEGDTLLESRFGQSIRLSGYNNSENEFAPTITIRNGQDSTTDSPQFTQIEEDINKDGNIIFLGSGNRLLDYKLPTENKKESFFSYPDELRGNQILLNSDRIILSAKTQQMIFAAKQDIGFITDGQFSIDTTQGINVTTDKDVFFDTKGATFNIDTNGGKVNLGFKVGDAGTDYALKGNVLLDILREFMEIVGQQIFVTPAGATAPGPTNNPKLNVLIQKLKTALSEKVQLK